jgi:hypothetical protein
MLVGDTYCARVGRIVRFRLRLSITWVVDYAISQSVKALDLSSKLTSQLSVAFVKFVSFKTVYVVNFKQGSVVLDLVVESNTDLTKQNQSSLANMLTRELQVLDGTLGPDGDASMLDPAEIYIGTTMLTAPLTTNCSAYEALDVCDQGNCTVVNYEPTCQCAPGYSGDSCDVTSPDTTTPTPQSDRTALIAGLSVMGAVLLLLLLALLVYCCCVRRRGDRQSRARYQEENVSQCSGSGTTANEGSMYSGSMKTRLTPRWTSDYTSTMYRYFDLNKDQAADRLSTA